MQDANLVDVQLYARRAGSNDRFDLYQGTDAFASEFIAEFDPTLLRNGQYQIVLQATDVNNQTSAVQTTVVVEGGLKVGHFSITLEDLNIPVAGIPVRVTRTYDSRRRHEALDFGHGWSIDYQNVSVEESTDAGRAILTNASIASARSLLKTAIVGTLIASGGLYVATSQSTKLLVRQCLNNDTNPSEKCRPNISIFVVGDSHDEIRDHVADAQGTGSPSTVTRRARPHPRGWIETLKRRGIVCQGGGQCDEYPMAIHKEGGQYGKTSLRSVNGSQNGSIGSKVRHFHNRCEIEVGDK